MHQYVWSGLFCLTSARVLHVFVLENVWPVSTRSWVAEKALCVLLQICGKLALAELTNDKWPVEESFLGAGRRDCRDKVAAANLEEESPMLRAHCWFAINAVSRLELAGKFWKQIRTWLEPLKEALSCAISQR